MRHPALILCLFLFVAACRPEETIVRKWPGGQKQITYKIYRGDTTHLVDVFLCAYFPNGHVWKSGYVKNGKEEGEWCSFYQSGKLKSKAFLSQGLNDGQYTVYYESGEEEQKGLCINGKVMLTEEHLYNRDGSTRDSNEDLTKYITPHPEKWTPAQVEEIHMDFYTAVASKYFRATEFSDCALELLQQHCNYKDIQPLTDLQRNNLLMQIASKKQTKDCMTLLVQ